MKLGVFAVLFSNKSFEETLNYLESQGVESIGSRYLRKLERLIDHARDFGADMVSGFTGRLTDLPIEESILKYKQIFGELSKRAVDKGVRIAFENCDMGRT